MVQLVVHHRRDVGRQVVRIAHRVVVACVHHHLVYLLQLVLLCQRVGDAVLVVGVHIVTGVLTRGAAVVVRIVHVGPHAHVPHGVGLPFQPHLSLQTVIAREVLRKTVREGTCRGHEILRRGGRLPVAVVMVPQQRAVKLQGTPPPSFLLSTLAVEVQS